MVIQLKLNSFADLINHHNFAVSDKNRKMFIDSEACCEARISTEQKPATVPTKAAALDSIFNFTNRNIAVKIDVEGHEMETLIGMTNLIANNKILLQIEIWGKHFDSLHWLIDRGFRLIHCVHCVGCIHHVACDYYLVNYEINEG